MLRTLYIAVILLFSVSCFAQDAKTFQYAKRDGVDKNLLSLDVYSKPELKDAPVMIMIHGGGWQNGDKTNPGMRTVKPKFFADNGFVYVSINYRLSPKVQHPAHIEDVAEAFAWVYDHIKDHGGDKNKIFVMGHSAGAHLAALLATDESRLKKHGRKLSDIKGVILLDGAGYDIPTQIKDADKIRRFAVIAERLETMYLQAFTEDASAQKAASPFYHVKKGTKYPPFLIFTANGRPDSVAQSNKLANALRETGASAEVIDAPGKNHGGVNADFGKPNDILTIKSKEFLEKYLKK